MEGGSYRTHDLMGTLGERVRINIWGDRVGRRLKNEINLGTQFLLLIQLEIPPVCSLIRCALLSILGVHTQRILYEFLRIKDKGYRLSGYRALQRLDSGNKSNSRQKKETRQEKKKFPRKTSRLSEYPNIIPALERGAKKNRLARNIRLF